MITVRGLHKRFGKLSVLEGIDLEIDSPGIITILGPNGSGKTTLIKCLLGMAIPDKGSLIFNGKDILGEWDYRNEISYMPQIARFPPNLKVIELFNMIKNLRRGGGDDGALIAAFKLEPVLDKKLSTLSGGTAQKVNIVLTFMFDSPVIILDEPTTGLDPVALLRFKKLIWEEKNKGKTILITTHIMSFVEEISDRIVFLLDGNIYFEGTVADIKTQTGENDLESAIATILQ
ncbi:MAG TPA: ABC transporter ATP-binding protein [Calditrichia bacterium]|nr:ABC transporter ATP-binding protein [Calditrichota bacterium]HQU71313.1 ABC transporter ATP-binding protein [Calditrichia bacterium]HQV32830.1 ABC transporter ATP-binding protein [Calditrichia bacterium]